MTSHSKALALGVNANARGWQGWAGLLAAITVCGRVA
jgi:hypothetical protein